MTLRSSTLDPLLSKLLTRQPLSDADQQAVTPLPHTVRRLSKAEYLVREGDRSPSVGVLLSGFAFRQKILSDGSRQIPLLPRLKERGGRCHIVNTASMAGIVPMITVGAYSSAKFASVGLSMVLSVTTLPRKLSLQDSYGLGMRRARQSRRAMALERSPELKDLNKMRGLKRRNAHPSLGHKLHQTLAHEL